MRLRFVLLCLSSCFAGSSSTLAEPFRILAWNVESNRPGQPPVSDINVISQQLSELVADKSLRPQIVALSEVEPKTVPMLQQAVARGLSSTVDYVTSASGGFKDTDSLMLIVDRARFEILDAYELHRYAGILGNMNVAEANNPEELGALRARSPLACRLKDKSNNVEFWVIANHLARGEADLRTEQAKMLREWAKDHPAPIIACGDFNFDYDFRSKQGNDGFKAMLVDDVWQWLKPDPLLDSNWSDDWNIKDRRVDRYPDSLLDFVFVANGAKGWRGEADVVVRPGDFPDNDQTSDHRPITAVFSP